MILPENHTWSIYLIRASGKYLGRVIAPDQKTAIEQAIKEFEITDPEQQKRLMARQEH
jgi:hypothetical protein